jgi:branched-chain amino acid transport system ATP-binding protein
VLVVQNLSKSFGGVRAVSGVSFAVTSGEMLALIGPNGAGKSTCFNMLGGQLKPDTGHILLAGQEIGGQPPRRICRLGVGRTFQITATFASMSVRENVQTALASHRRQSWGVWNAADALYREDADALLAQVSLTAEADRPAGILAYGDLKRLELAMALAGDPKLLLMDEPTAGMAPAERNGLMALTAGLAQARGMAVLFTEHDMDVVFGVASRILVMDRGELIAQGDAAMIRADRRVREVYLGTGASSGGH